VQLLDPRNHYLTLGLLALCTILGLMVAFRFQREVDHDLSPSTEKDLLDPLEKAFYSGLMDEAEFQRIRESMVRLKADEAAPASKRAGPRPPRGAVPDPGPEVDPDGA
jgi:hypothetical protein